MNVRDLRLVPSFHAIDFSLAEWAPQIVGGKYLVFFYCDNLV